MCAASQASWVPPDGGWGWVVMGCSVVLHALTLGTQLSLSVLYVSWLETFGDGRGTTSWIISISLAVAFAMSPIPAALANRFGFRVVVVVGGILTSIGYIFSYFATSVSFLVLSIGLVTGCGSCCVYMSAVAIVCVYFDKRRPVAMGIACGGTGLGALVMAPLFNYLEHVYGWRGAILIMGAITLHICACGLLLRPIKTKQDYEDNVIDMEDTCGKINSEEESHLFYENRYTDTTDEKMDIKFPQCNEVVEDNISGPSLTTEPKLVPDVGHSTNAQNKSWSCYRSTQVSKAHRSPNDKHVSSVQLIKELSNSRRSMQCVHDKDSIKHKDVRPYSSLRDLNRQMKSNSHVSINLLFSRLGKKISLDTLTARSVKHLDRISLLGSVPSHILHSATIDEKAEVEDEETDNFEDKDQDSSSCFVLCKTGFMDSVKNNIELLKDPSFLQFGISNLLTCLSFATPQMYLADRAVDTGMSTTVGALLVSLCGFGNLFGRISIGVMTYRLLSDRLMTYIVVLFLAGAFTMASPLCGDDVILHVIYAFLVGYFLGGYATLVAVITVDIMGVTKATSSYGLLLTFMGFSTLTGPPFAGLLFDWTQSYTVSYILYGFFLISSTALLIPIYCIRKRRKSMGRKQTTTTNVIGSSLLLQKQEQEQEQGSLTFQDDPQVP